MKKFFKVFGSCVLMGIVITALTRDWGRFVGCIALAVFVYTVMGIPYLIHCKTKGPSKDFCKHSETGEIFAIEMAWHGMVK